MWCAQKLFFLVSSHRVGTGTKILSWLARDRKSIRNKGFSLCWPEGEHYFWWIIFTQGQKSPSKHVPVSLSLIQKQYRNYLQTQVLIYWLWQLLSSCLPCHDNKVIEIEVESNWQTPRTIAKLAQVHFFIYRIQPGVLHWHLMKAKNVPKLRNSLEQNSKLTSSCLFIRILGRMQYKWCALELAMQWHSDYYYWAKNNPFPNTITFVKLLPKSRSFKKCQWPHIPFIIFRSEEFLLFFLHKFYILIFYLNS